MSSFTANPRVELLPDHRRGLGLVKLIEPFAYDVGFEGSGDMIVVPVGFVTDLASIPWFARPFLPNGGPVAKAAILHDWLLFTGDPRSTKIFDEALGVAGVSPLLRWLMVTAVMLWGRLFRRVRRRSH